jgi:hypothetical protein
MDNSSPCDCSSAREAGEELGLPVGFECCGSRFRVAVQTDGDAVLVIAGTVVRVRHDVMKLDPLAAPSPAETAATF